MREAFPDPMAKWTPTPDWRTARLARPDWQAAPVLGLYQTLLSGDLAAAFASLRPPPESVGLWQIARGAAAIRIARDRALLVSPEAPAMEHGWRDGGWAATDASDAYVAFDLAGAGLRGLVAEATTAELEAVSPSAAILFAGVAALLYRTAEHAARLHVELGFAPYVWRWLETR